LDEIAAVEASIESGKTLNVAISGIKWTIIIGYVAVIIALFALFYGDEVNKYNHLKEIKKFGAEHYQGMIFTAIFIAVLMFFGYRPGHPVKYQFSRYVLEATNVWRRQFIVIFSCLSVATAISTYYACSLALKTTASLIIGLYGLLKSYGSWIAGGGP
jgi:hypothetical protein